MCKWLYHIKIDLSAKRKKKKRGSRCRSPVLFSVFLFSLFISIQSIKAATVFQSIVVFLVSATHSYPHQLRVLSPPPAVNVLTWARIPRRNTNFAVPTTAAGLLTSVDIIVGWSAFLARALLLWWTGKQGSGDR
jgi:hypothetical protein